MGLYLIKYFLYQGNKKSNPKQTKREWQLEGAKMIGHHKIKNIIELAASKSNIADKRINSYF